TAPSEISPLSLHDALPIFFSGTFEGAYGWYADLWNRWQGPNDDGGKSFSLPTWTNRAVYPGGREDPEIKRQESLMPPDLFQERRSEEHTSELQSRENLVCR